MSNKIILSILMILLFSCFAIGQSDKLFKHLSNDSISFDILKVSFSLIGKNKATEPKSLIKIIKTKLEAKLVKRLKCEDWIIALNDSTIDWAANLLLYELYEKDASSFMVIKTREEWVGTYKEEDIDYWRKILNDKKL